jgi:hypothetical protein
VVAPSRLARDAAEVLGPVRDQVVVIGALAVEVALEGHDVLLTPSGDIDAGTDTADAAEVISHLEAAGLRRSSEPHERAFTWTKDDVKVQLIRPFHPFPKPPVAGLPENNLVGELEGRRWLVAFEDAPQLGRFWAARPAILVALKENAFGRTRPSGEPVDRDFSDVALLFEFEADRIVSEAAGDAFMRSCAIRAAETLLEDQQAREAAARELVSSGQEENTGRAMAAVVRSAREIVARLGP